MEYHHEITNLAIVLAAAFLGGALFQKLRQPVLVGYIIVGFILGPSVFNIISGLDQIGFLSELGILLLLFIIGLELDLKAFKSVSRISLVTCGAQIGLGFLFMSLFGYFLDWPLNTAILMGFAVSLSSTAVALKILEDVGLRQTKIGITSIGILIAQDLAVIPMLLIIGALSTQEGFNYVGIFRLVAAIFIMIGVISVLHRKPKFFQKIWKWFEAHKLSAMTGQTTVTALAFCFAASAIAGSFGLSAAYGAFLAGIVLGQSISKQKLEEHAKPVFDIMIMVFFISIGILIDLDFMVEHWFEISILLFAAMLLKTVINYGLLRWQGMDKQEAIMTGAVLAQIGEFSFVLASLGISTGSVGEEVYKLTVSVITLSLLFTPLWLLLVKKFGLLKNRRLRRKVTTP